MAIQRVVLKNPTLRIVVIVPTKVLKDQWLENIESIQIDADITVMVINTAAAKPFKCDFLILDEEHKYNSEWFRQIFLNCSPAFILGLTATYERLDGLEKEVMDKYCPVCDTISVEEATANGWLSPYKEYKVLLEVDLTEYNKANQEFLKYFSFFNYDFTLAMDAVTNFFTQQKIAKQLNCTVQDVKAAAYSWNRALRFRKQFVSNHPKKIEVAKKILEHRIDKKAITFNSSIKQCEAYKCGYIVHSQNSKKANRLTLEEFSHCTTGVIHSSKMLIEGLDCPGLNLAIITGFNSSKTAKIQEIGRTIRKEPEKEAEIFTLVLKGTVEESWYSKSMEGLDYIEINEEELDHILKYEQLSNKLKIQQQTSVNNFLRF